MSCQRKYRSVLTKEVSKCIFYVSFFLCFRFVGLGGSFDKLRMTLYICIVIPDKGVFFITVFTTNFAIVTLSTPVLTKEVSKCFFMFCFMMAPFDSRSVGTG